MMCSVPSFLAAAISASRLSHVSGGYAFGSLASKLGLVRLSGAGA
jgi:hypothetical protein